MKVIDQALLKKVIIERPRSSHKGDYGRLLLIGGTYPYGGAIIMAALGAVRSGAGLVTVATDKRVASTYDLHKRLVTSDYCSHTTTIDTAISIFKIGQLLSAVKAFGRDAEELVLDSRNAASDPADYFDYIMFGWSNTTSGYRLAMERLLGRAPSEEELQEKFIPGVSFHFLYEELIQAPGYMFDGYHVAKIKDMLNLFSELYICIIPTHNKSQFENIIPTKIQDRVHYLDYAGEDLEEWTKKVYQVVLKQSDKG